MLCKLFLCSIIGILCSAEYKKNDSVFCWSCQGGFESDCAKMLLIGKWLNCGPKASCYEAVISYNNGALKLVQRRCFTPPNNNTSLNFCNTPYSNPVGRILECHSCNTTKCNSHLIKSENYGHDGHFLMNETGDWSKIVSPLYDSFSINDYLEVGN